MTLIESRIRALIASLNDSLRPECKACLWLAIDAQRTQELPSEAQLLAKLRELQPEEPLL